MNIVIFADNVTKKHSSIHWKVFIDYLLDKNYNIFFITESIISKNNIELFNKNINVISINENIDLKKNYDLKISNYYSEKYIDTNIFKERLSIKTSWHSLFYDNIKNYENILLSHIIFFENFLKDNKIKILLSGIVNAYQSYNDSIIENVCLKKGIKFLIYQNPILRFRVYDNQIRSSEDIDKIYQNNKKKSLSIDNELKVVNFIDSYKKYLKHDDHYGYLYKKIVPKKFLLDGYSLFHYKNFFPSFKKNINSLKRIIFNRKIQFIHTEEITTDYSILILNKVNNYRLLKFSSHYSNMALIIRNIALSLPLNHLLVVKLHPHDILSYTNIIDIINETKIHHNVKILNPNISFSNIVQESSIVFSLSSTAALEALMYYKKVIIFGKNILHFGFNEGPLKRSFNFEDLSLLINDFLNFSIDKDDIHKYFYAFLKNSYSKDLSNDNDWHKVNLFAKNNHELFLKAAICLDKYINHSK